MRGRVLMVLAVAIAGDAAESDIGRKSPLSQIEQPLDPATGLWLPSMKVKKFKKFQNKSGLKGCKWSNLNAPGTEPPQSDPY